MSKKIAIIGSGISGLTCAHLLHKLHDVTVFEANDYIGGHTATKDVSADGQSIALDTGFIVFNDWTYPNFIKLLSKLGVSWQPSEMSFSVKNLPMDLEYNGNTLNSLFAQRRNILRPAFWRIVRDILRFNRLCKKIVLDDSALSQLTLFEFIRRNEFSEDFTYNYILPMCAAIWSTSIDDIKAFPFMFFLRFFNNHGLLNISHRPQWYTITGGSRSYIGPLIQGFEDKIRLNCPVLSVVPDEQGIALTTPGQTWQFDEVIFACHSDQALSMLTQANAAQQQILGDIRYAQNEVVLHTDTTILPHRPLAWASWNYLITDTCDGYSAPAVLTYNMNILQNISSKQTFCVTLNHTNGIKPSAVLGTYHYAHPQFNQKALIAQARRAEISGRNGLHFCGAYWYNGFHEDGVRSALDVCAHFGVTL